jgi:hypothetical protein
MQSVGDITQALDNERDVCHLLTMDIDTTLRLAYTVSKRDSYQWQEATRLPRQTS